jgi:hypothetical protein
VKMLSGHEDVLIGSKISNEAGHVLRHADPAHGDSPLVTPPDRAFSGDMEMIRPPFS